MQKKLTAKQIRYLRALGHHLEPMAMVGQLGMSKEVIAAVNAALNAHELIKVKVQNTSSLDRHQAAEELAAATKAALVQVIGRSVLLFRANKEIKQEKRIVLP